MNAPAYAPPKICFKCGYEANTIDDRCPQCKSRLKTKTTVRVLGGVLVFLGGILMAGMAVLAILMGGVIANSDRPDSTTRFTGSDSDMMFMFGILALVFFFGLVAFAAGAWQLIFGRRNLILVWTLLGLGALFFIAGSAVQFLD